MLPIVGAPAHAARSIVPARGTDLAGAAAWDAISLQFLLPALVGNVVGGTALFALIAYAQVVEEI